jgi:hypothetical protein
LLIVSRYLKEYSTTMTERRSFHKQKDAPTSEPETKNPAEANPKKWRGPCFSNDATNGNKTDTDTKKLVEAKPGSSQSSWQKKLLGGATTALLLLAEQSQSAMASSTSDGHRNGICPISNDTNHTLEHPIVFNSIPVYGDLRHPDLPALRVGGVEVPYPTADRVEAMLQDEQFKKELPGMCQRPEAYQCLRELAKNQIFIESMSYLCTDESFKQHMSDLLSRDPEFKKSLEDLVCKPEYQQCLEDLVCDPGLRQGFEEVNQMYSDEPVANTSKQKKKGGGGELVGLYIGVAIGVIVFICTCADGRQVAALRPF